MGDIMTELLNTVESGSLRTYTRKGVNWYGLFGRLGCCPCKPLLFNSLRWPALGSKRAGHRLAGLDAGQPSGKMAKHRNGEGWPRKLLSKKHLRLSYQTGQAKVRLSLGRNVTFLVNRKALMNKFSLNIRGDFMHLFSKRSPCCLSPTCPAQG